MLSHKAVGTILHETLTRSFTVPFSFLDIACGDASLPKRVLPDTSVRHYHGIDLSEPAIELAAANLEDMAFEVDLDHRDFVEAMADRPESADVAWCSLSIHHLETDDKLSLMRAIRGATGSVLMIYEPTRRDDEDRAAYLERFIRVNQPLWTMLTVGEWNQIERHVTTSDLPETAPAWLDLGRRAGFSTARQVFVDPTELLPALPLRSLTSQS